MKFTAPGPYFNFGNLGINLASGDTVIFKSTVNIDGSPLTLEPPAGTICTHIDTDQGSPMAKKETKTTRFGMRISPNKKEIWTQTAHAWGYNSVSEWLEKMADWAIQYDNVGGDYNAYLETIGGKK